MTRRLLKDLRIDEVSSVDRGAGRGVQVLLMKRDATTGDVLDFSKMRDALKKGFPKNGDAAADKAQAVVTEIVNKAVEALGISISSIIADDTVVDKAAAIAESVGEFQEHLQTVEKTDMTTQPKIEDVTKQLEASNVEKAELAAKLAWAEMSDVHKQFAKDFSPEDKKKFAAKTPADRDKDCEDAKKRAGEDPILKAERERNETLQKRIDALEKKDEEAVFTKRATDIGMKADQGDLLRKAFKGGDPDAQAELLKHIDTIIKARDAALKLAKATSELGGAGDGSAVDGAYAELQKLAEEFRKTDAGSKLTPSQAFDKVLTDPANAELAKRERAERMQKISKGAA